VLPLVITLQGEYSAHTHSLLGEALTPSLERRFVVVDFSRVDYIDSTALSELVLCRRRRMAKGYPPKHFAGVNEKVRLILKTTNLDTIWPMFESVDEAVESFERDA
jgi:anti-anti-sigma factor